MRPSVFISRGADPCYVNMVVSFLNNNRAGSDTLSLTRALTRKINLENQHESQQ